MSRCIDDRIVVNIVYVPNMVFFFSKSKIGTKMVEKRTDGKQVFSENREQ